MSSNNILRAEEGSKYNKNNMVLNLNVIQEEESKEVSPTKAH